MKSKFALLIIFFIFSISCKKETNVAVTPKTTGTIVYKLLDDSGKGIANVKVSLFDNVNNINYNSPILLDTRITDQNGAVNFGELNPETYLLVPDSPMVNKVKYYVRDFLQIVSNVDKEKDTKVSDFSGTLNINVKSSYNDTYNAILKNVGVLLVPSSKFAYGADASYYFNICDYKGVSDDLGNLSFKVPSSITYYFILYNVSTNAIYYQYDSYAIDKSATISIQLYARTPG